MAQAQGTTLEWKDTGGDYTLTQASLADGAGRAGAEHDWGVTGIPDKVLFEVQFDPNVAPTAGEVVNYFVAEGSDGTNYPGEVTGSDAAFSSEDDAARLAFVGAVPASNDTDPHRGTFVFFPSARYFVPVVMNQSGQAFTSSTSDHWIKVTPLS